MLLVLPSHASVITFFLFYIVADVLSMSSEPGSILAELLT